jgi:hypothetical protein
MRKGFIIAIFLIIVLYACKHDVVTPAAQTTGATGGTVPGQGGGQQQQTVVCFEAEIPAYIP